MTDEDWRRFFEICGQVLGMGATAANESESWCSWTTFERLSADAGYWTAGIPNRGDLRSSHIADGGIWGQPFAYQELAHVIIPRTFDQKFATDSGYRGVRKHQDITLLSRLLTEDGIAHWKTELVLEIKLF